MHHDGVRSGFEVRGDGGDAAVDDAQVRPQRARLGEGNHPGILEQVIVGQGGAGQ
ncbi:MAG: hypothetical protein U5Q16_11530 [Gammaproteobacteria bacterium]|nr:hypothetical protein [Gammaproteobacteria bacterium]